MAPGHRLRAMIKIVGVDPGLSATGVGVVRGQGLKVAAYSFGCITTSQASPLPERLDRIFSQLLTLFSEETPDLVVVEDVFSLKAYPKSGISLGQVSGVVILAAARAGIRCAEIPVREAKQVLTGNGNASKVQLESAVRRQLHHPAPIRPHHASDALGLAIIGLFRCGGVSHGAIGRGRQSKDGAAWPLSGFRKRTGNTGSRSR
jgi:crossover junction endodeoxyribonuclease RuvC